MEKQYQILLKKKTEYYKAIESMEAILLKKVQFHFTVEFQPADGFVICDDDAHNAPLSQCIKTIKGNGKLTHEMYLDLTI